MTDRNSSFLGTWRNQDHSVTEDRIFLGTQERDAIQFGSLNDPLQTALEQFCAGETIVLYFSVTVTRAVRGPRAQFFAKKYIPNPGGSEGLAQSLSVELGVEAAVRR